MLKKMLNIIIAILILVDIILIGLFIMDEKNIIDLPFMLEKEERDVLIKIVDDYEISTSEKESKNVNRKNKDYEKYVFVGDSRFVGMSKYSTSDKDVFIAKVGEGYNYLLQQMSNIKYQCDENTALIIGLGVNDAHSNCDKYIATINEMAETMECQIYFVSVNPVDEAQAVACGYNVSSDAVELFNDAMCEQLDESIVYIDTNTYLHENGYETQDGLHFAEYVNEDLYNYIKAFVGPDEN